MDKDRLIKILRWKTYYEKERDKCLSNMFFYLAILAIFTFKASNYSGIKKIKEIGWSNAGGWNRFSCISDWILVIIFVIYSVIFCYCFLRIQACSRKLIHINIQLLEELNSPLEVK